VLIWVLLKILYCLPAESFYDILSNIKFVGGEILILFLCTKKKKHFALIKAKNFQKSLNMLWDAYKNDKDSSNDDSLSKDNMDSDEDFKENVNSPQNENLKISSQFTSNSGKKTFFFTKYFERHFLVPQLIIQRILENICMISKHIWKFTNTV
jgi:hypothetical protein